MLTELHGLARFPEPLAPVAAASRAGMALPTRDALTSWVRGVDAPDRLTLVEGAGGLLVELGHGGVTLRDLASRSGRAGASGGGTWFGHAEPHGVDSGSAYLAWYFVRRPGDRRVAAVPGAAELGNRDALGRAGAGESGAAAGAGSMTSAEFEAASLAAFDPQWVASLV